MDKSTAASILGVERGASPEEIQKAYRRAAMLHHPDRNLGDEGAAERFRQCKDAFEELSSPEEPEPFAFGGFGDFESLFGAIFGGSSSRRTAAVELSFAEALAGGRREIPRGPWGDQAISIKLPPGIASGSTASVEVGGRSHELHFVISPAHGWRARGHDLYLRLSLSVFDQILGAAESIVLPDGSSMSVTIPEGLDEGQALELEIAKFKPYTLIVELDFSKELRLNDTDRKQLSKIRANIKKREDDNGK